MVLGLVSVPSVWADTIIPASQSCRTDILNPATNRHDASKLSVRSDASSAKSWIKFDLGGLDVSTLKTATLTVTLVEDKSTDKNFDVSYVNDDCRDNIGWTELNLTWNNAPGNNTTDFAGLDKNKTTLLTTVNFTGGVAGQAFTIDVLKALQTDTDGIVQFVLHNANVLMNFATHDHATEAWRPFLTVTVGKASQAMLPAPADGATVPRSTALSWKPGVYAATHDVYFGASFTDVNAASRTKPLGVLVSQGQDPNTYTPAAPLNFGQTYYWRIDEVNAPPSSTIYKGAVWSFTVEPLATALPTASITATASSSGFGSNPASTINGSGLTGDLHSIDTTTMWCTANNATGPAWIRYDFDRLYKLQEMWVWNYNDSLEFVLNIGMKNVTVEYSSDGLTFKTLGNYILPQAPSATGYAHGATISFGVAARSVRITATSNYGGVASGLSEVRFYSIPVQARQPQPAPGTQNIGVAPTLTWWAGREAVSHKVYLGTDANNLPLAGTVAVTSYTASLNLGTTYYWRVDEVNNAAAVPTWTGTVWSFTTVGSLVFDNMESYNDTNRAVFDTWVDGYDHPTTNGAQIGYAQSASGTFNETKTTHGGKQSMPFKYNNANGTMTSEAVRTFDTVQDWTVSGITSLSLYFYGQTTNPTAVPFWIKLTDQSGKGAKVTYGAAAGEDVANLAKAAWTQWKIPLSGFSGVTLSKIKSVTIGFGPGAGTGTIFLDDMQLGQ
jgi:hypothetical protein